MKEGDIKKLHEKLTNEGLLTKQPQTCNAPRRSRIGAEMMVNYFTQKKVNGKWEDVCSPTTDREKVYNSLAHDLIAKKLEQCTYIKRIKRLQLYNGFIVITITYTNELRRVYTVESN